MKIFIFGAHGMLGSYLHKYFTDSIPIKRDRIDAMKIQKRDFYSQLNLLGMSRGDVIINAIGIINKRDNPPMEFFIVNSLFPRLLADYCEKWGINLIHISTDCVFNGSEGNYDEADVADDVTVYGISKSAGEPHNCTVIRASIIGENKNNSQDLLEWVRTHKNTVVPGWTNHIWNGVTCLHLSKICEWIIERSFFWSGVRHIFSPTAISKAGLAEMISNVYGLNNEIDKIRGPYDCDRTLSTLFPMPFVVPPLLTQITEQKNFKL